MLSAVGGTHLLYPGPRNGSLGGPRCKISLFQGAGFRSQGLPFSGLGLEAGSIRIGGMARAFMPLVQDLSRGVECY